MPYFLILLVVVLAVSGRFIFATAASPRAKALVACACVATVALPHVLPRWQLVGLLGQVVLVVALVLQAKVAGARAGG